jgi:DNA-binding NtrC family response regulator
VDVREGVRQLDGQTDRGDRGRLDERALQDYHWPGNIRQLRNVIERAMILCQGPKLYIKLSRTALRPIAVIANHPPAFDIARGCKADSASAFDLSRHNGWGS